MLRLMIFTAIVLTASGSAFTQAAGAGRSNDQAYEKGLSAIPGSGSSVIPGGPGTGPAGRNGQSGGEYAGNGSAREAPAGVGASVGMNTGSGGSGKPGGQAGAAR